MMMNEFEIWFFAIGGVPRPEQLLFAIGFGFPRSQFESSSEVRSVSIIQTIIKKDHS